MNKLLHIVFLTLVLVATLFPPVAVAQGPEPWPTAPIKGGTK